MSAGTGRFGRALGVESGIGLAAGWVALLVLAPRWSFYRFSIDGRARHDRSAGELKSADGQAPSLALISGDRAA